MKYLKNKLVYCTAALFLAACGSSSVPTASSAVPTSSTVPASISGGLSFAGLNWSVYGGSGALGQAWSPTHVSVSGGVLKETVSNGVGGGVGLKLDKGVGTTWTVRFRMTTGPGKWVILLMPNCATGACRPEVDFTEGKKGDSQRTVSTATYHPLAGCTGCIQAKLPGDYTQWHTASAHWTNTNWVLSMDGKPWVTFPHGSASTMRLHIQTDATSGGGSSSLYVSSVQVS